MIERVEGIVLDLVSAEAGTNVNGGEFNVCLISELSGMEALHAPIPPEHLKVRGVVKVVKISRPSVDHEMQQDKSGGFQTSERKFSFRMFFTLHWR
ncbi:MAG: hypothetical protein DBY36_01395 [Clostridiales bacterium]|nr:MAG: hypothetical protein DBY36_01395 [Clostridiales bacterium]